MLNLGVFLIYAAVFLRAAVVVSGKPEFPVVMALLAVYGVLLTAKTWLVRRGSPPRGLQLSYLCLQAILTIAILITSFYEDFIAMLFVPLSLDAVSFFGRRAGFASIGVFSLATIATLLHSHIGPLFGLTMGILYSGVCFLVGGFAFQVQKARAAHEHNEAMLAELQTAHRQLQGYADQMASLAIEHERSRLARELHDSVTQTVFSMNLAAQSASLLLDRQPGGAADQLLRIEDLAASALGEIQSLVSQLKPVSISEEGLPGALRRLGMEQKARTGLQVSLEMRVDENIPERVAAGLYAIAQEALINVSKHSEVCEASVRLNADRDRGVLEIEDHGRGFDPGGILEERGHLGLAGMFERADEIGWSLTVLSRPGEGTRVVATQKSTGS
jgi:signal transduction histidine kinase